MVKIYKYRDKLYRVELIITFALKYNNVTHLAFLLGTPSQFLSVHVAHAHKGIILYVAFFSVNLTDAEINRKKRFWQ